MDVDEFMRRFLMHVLPKGFRRIRHFGFLANACRVEKLARIRAVCGNELNGNEYDTGEFKKQIDALTFYAAQGGMRWGAH